MLEHWAYNGDEQIKEAVNRLMGELPGIHIGIIAHGDYCDARSTYVTRHLDLTHDTTSIIDFVNTAVAKRDLLVGVQLLTGVTACLHCPTSASTPRHERITLSPEAIERGSSAN